MAAQKYNKYMVAGSIKGFLVSCESWLVRFSVRRHLKKPKIKPTFFFERVNFAFSDVIPRGISACKILPL